MNQSRDDTLVDVERVEEHFQRRCRATVLMPYDPHLQAGAESDLSALAEPTRDAYLHLAAEVADGFRDAPRSPLL
jgi:MinD-like ATPase involved in chromosome partitioning or flagellar assembly